MESRIEMSQQILQGFHLAPSAGLDCLQPGKEATLPPPPPLRTARESFPSGSSSLHERPLRDAAALVRPSCTWICR